MVLLRIADRVRRDVGVAWPGVRSIAADCGMSKATVLKRIDRLVTAGLLIIEKHSQGISPRHYRVNLPALASGLLVGPHEVATSGLTTRPLAVRDASGLGLGGSGLGSS